MNHANEETLVIEHAGLRLEVPQDAALRALLAKLGVVPPPIATPLPLIGAQWQGGIYAGLTIHDERPFGLILLPGEFNGKWSPAVSWATEQGGYLPSRFDQLVLLKNLKAEFKPEWYWSAERYAGDDAYAWNQSFGIGGQTSNHEDGDYRARAVRRLTIQ